jgi:hypothetical protein
VITLYSTSGCHLCEQAYALLLRIGVPTSQIDTVDIAFDDVLFQRYGIQIPVLSFAVVNGDSAEQQLNWPFDAPQLQSWLENNGFNYHQ